MNKKGKTIILSIVGVTIVIVLVILVTSSFMKRSDVTDSCDDGITAKCLANLDSNLYDEFSVAKDDYGNIRYVGRNQENYTTYLYDGNSITSYDYWHPTDESINTIYKLYDHIVEDEKFKWTEFVYYDSTFEENLSDFKNVEWDDTDELCYVEGTDIVVGTYSYGGIYYKTECTGMAYYDEDRRWVAGIEKIENPSVTVKTISHTINNYVSFNDELWRIIGVFDVDDGTGNIEKRFKLIRSEVLEGVYAWDSGKTMMNDSNDWTDSQLMIYLNDLKSCESGQSWCLTSTAQSQIEDAVWSLGESTMTTAKGFYLSERGTEVYSGHATSWTGKVGLMYVSDYAYATDGGSAEGRNYCLSKYLEYWEYNSDCYNNDWLIDGTSNDYSQKLEWFLTPRLDKYGHYAYFLEDAKIIDVGLTSFSLGSIRPVVYLKSNAKLVGEGTKDSPYEISLS